MAEMQANKTKKQKNNSRPAGAKCCREVRVLTDTRLSQQVHLRPFRYRDVSNHDRTKSAGED